MVAEECHLHQEVNSRWVFLPFMVRRYSISNHQYESIVRIMGKQLSAHLDGVAFGLSTEMGGQAVGLYPSKYGGQAKI